IPDSHYQITVNFHRRTDFAKSESKPVITLKTTSVAYDGTEQKPEIESVVCAGKTLDASLFKVTKYEDNVNAGTGRVYITGLRYYMGENNTTFSITQRDINHVKIDSVAPLVYTGQPIKPVLVVTDSVKIGDRYEDILNRIEGKADYTVEYKNNINVGTAQVSVVATRINYDGIKTGFTFEILPKNLTGSEDLKITAIPAVKYTGEPFKPDPEIKDGNLILVNGRDYDVSYIDNVIVGTATVNITFKGNYTGTAQTTFDILDDIKNRDINVEFADGNRWATYYWDEYLEVPEGLQAYVVEGHKENSTELQLKQIDMIPANVGVLLYRTDEVGQNSTFKADTKPFGTTMSEGITPNTTLFVGSKSGIPDLSTIEGTKFVLSGDQFVQAVGGQLPANRCYLNFGSAQLDDVQKIDIKADADSIIIMVEGVANKAGGTVTRSSVSKGKVTLTITPNGEYYAEAADINVKRFVSANTSRAPQVDGGEVALTAADADADPSGVTKYTFDYTANSHYQISVNFHRRADFAKSESRPVITLATTSFAYDGSERKPEVVSVVSGGVTLDAESYEVSYEDNVNAGTGRVVIVGKRQYMGQNNTTFRITQRDIKLVQVAAIAPVVYTGQPITPALLVTDSVQIGDEKVDILNRIEDKPDYTIDYKNNLNVGTAQVSVVANKINYDGTKTGITFEILPKNLSLDENKPTIEPIAEQVFTGEELKPAIVVKDGDITLAEGTDFDVVYTDNTDAGVATATITFKGNYSGTAVRTFNIVDHGLPRSFAVSFDSSNEWTTYFSTENLTLTDQLKAYVVTSVEGMKVNTTEVSFIPKNTPVLLHRESGDSTTFSVKTCSGERLAESIKPSAQFVGTTTSVDFATISGTVFVLVNGKFVQAAEGTLAANRCYLVVSEPAGVAELAINRSGSAIIYQENGVATTANIGTATTSAPKDGKVTLTVKPNSGYYVEPSDISIVRNANASTARAPQFDIDNSEVAITTGPVTINADYTSTYEFSYAYEEGCQYQIAVNFHKAANLQETGKTAITFAQVAYTGYELKLEPEVRYDGQLLTKDVDYVLSYPDADYTRAAKGKKVLVNGIQRYTKELSPTYDIAQRSVGKITVAAKDGQTWVVGHTIDDAEPQVVYTGLPIELSVTDIIKDADGHDKDLLSDAEVSISYTANQNAGAASLTIKSVQGSNYDGTRTLNYTILAKAMTADDIAAISDHEYTGSAIEPALTIRYGDFTLVAGTDYDVVYSDNVNAGEATATVTFKGNYSGTAEKHFRIVDVLEQLAINFGSNEEWATYYCNRSLELSDDLKAYVVTGYDGREVKTEEVSFIPKDIPVLLYNKSGQTQFTVKTCSGVELPADIQPSSVFRGTAENVDIATIAGTKFVLNGDQFVLSGEGILPANHCYLLMPADVAGVTTLAIGKGISETIVMEEGRETNAAGTARVISTPDANGNLTLVVSPKQGFYADLQNLRVVASVNASSARAPQLSAGAVQLTLVDGYSDTGREARYTFPYTKGYAYQVTVDFQKCVNFQTRETQPTITLEEGTYVYDGTEKKPKIASVTMYDGTLTLTEGRDYSVAYDNNVNAGGTARVSITGMNHYTSVFSRNFNIGQRDINLVTVDTIPQQTFTGDALQPALVVRDIVTIDGEEVDILNAIDGKADYTPEYTNNVNVGQADVVIRANAINYTGVKGGQHFTIVPKDLSAAGNEPTIEAVAQQWYTGEPVEPQLVIYDGQRLVPADCYDVAYTNNVNEGEATATVTFKGNYKGEATTTFQIVFQSETMALNVDFGAGDEWTTYYSPIDLKDVEGLGIYVVTGLGTGQGLDLKTEAIEYITKNVAVLLQRTDKTRTAFSGQTMPSNTTLQGVTPDADLFRGTLSGIADMSTIDGIKYILYNDRFVQAVDGSLAANRCYVHLTSDMAQNINVVDESADADGVVIQEEGKSSKSAGSVYVTGPRDGYKTITVIPASVLYATQDEIRVVRSLKAATAAAPNRAPGIENTPVEVIPVDATADPSSRTEYRFAYDERYNYQVTVDFQKRVDLSNRTATNPVVLLVEAEQNGLVYDGKAKTPSVERVTCNGIIVDPANYTVSYQNNVNAGRPRVVITGKRFLMGSTYTEFDISKRDFSNVTVEEPIPDQEYTGSPIIPVGIIMRDIVDGANILRDTDYELICENNVEVGTAKVTIKPMNNYYGSWRDYYFNIVPATGIVLTTADGQEDGRWFDISGHPLQGRPTQKGVYILRDSNQRTFKVRIK
ncbi:MAG: hypothetical protein IJ637_00455, partial [Prevotella sp.]|nr:hypothetical protein [Prevotella sp.]